MSLKSVIGEVNSRMYTLLISVRALAASSSDLTVAFCTAIELLSSASTTTCSDTEAKTSFMSRICSFWSTLTMRSTVRKPVALTVRS